jgi:hypothetical protein
MKTLTLERVLGMDDKSQRNKNRESNSGFEELSIDEREDDDESRYPPFKTVILSMASIYAAFFLTALVSIILASHSRPLVDSKYRTELSSALLSQPSPTNSRASAISRGTKLPSC